MQQRVRLGISSCLLGNAVRWNAGHKLDRFLTNTLGQFVIPILQHSNTPKRLICGLSQDEFFTLGC